MADQYFDNKKILVESQKDIKITPKPVDIELDTSTNWAASLRQSSNLSSLEDNVPEEI